MAESDGPRHVKPMIFPSQLARRGRGEEGPGLPLPESPPSGEPRLTLHVVNTAVADAPPEIVTFRQPRVTVGRSRTCDLRLEDDKQVVSGKHAEISLEGGNPRVTDLASRNLTYLDGEALEPHKPYPITPDATVTIAEFAFRVEAATAEPAPTEAPTVFDESYENPFREEAARLAGVLAKLSELYAAEAPGRRDQALHEAVEKALGEEGAGGLRSILGRVFGGG